MLAVLLRDSHKRPVKIWNSQYFSPRRCRWRSVGCEVRGAKCKVVTPMTPL